MKSPPTKMKQLNTIMATIVTKISVITIQARDQRTISTLRLLRYETGPPIPDLVQVPQAPQPILQSYSPFQIFIRLFLVRLTPVTRIWQD